MILPQGKIFNMLRNRLDSRSLSKNIYYDIEENKINPINIEACFQAYQSIFGLNR
jgi:hypothetical protein